MVLELLCPMRVVCVACRGELCECVRVVGMLCCVSRVVCGCVRVCVVSCERVCVVCCGGVRVRVLCVVRVHYFLSPYAI